MFKKSLHDSTNSARSPFASPLQLIPHRSACCPHGYLLLDAGSCHAAFGNLESRVTAGMPPRSHWGERRALISSGSCLLECRR
jgi:hypothetical protein